MRTEASALQIPVFIPITLWIVYRGTKSVRYPPRPCNTHQFFIAWISTVYDTSIVNSVPFVKQ